jgi:hypothetical protein
MLCFDTDTSVSSTEKDSLISGFKTIFRDRVASTEFQCTLPEEIKDYSTHYQKNRADAIMPGHQNAEYIFIIKYSQQMTFGLSGDLQFSGYVGGADFFNGAGYSSVPLTINVTDENPEWQYRSMFQLDIYNTINGKRVLTTIKNEESSSDDKSDRNSFLENISTIIEDIQESLFKRAPYSQYVTIINNKQPLRNEAELKAAMTKSLFPLFACDGVQLKTYSIPLIIDEFGTVKPDTTPLQDSIAQLIVNCFSSHQFQRVVKPGDTAHASLQFTVSSFFGKKLINGYYCSMQGTRDNQELWNILYQYIDEFVKHFTINYPDNGNKEAIHISFFINTKGKCENMKIIEATALVQKKAKKILEDLIDWDFGIKRDERFPMAEVEVVFSFDKNKSIIKIK